MLKMLVLLYSFNFIFYGKVWNCKTSICSQDEFGSMPMKKYTSMKKPAYGRKLVNLDPKNYSFLKSSTDIMKEFSFGFQVKLRRSMKVGIL